MSAETLPQPSYPGRDKPLLEKRLTRRDFVRDVLQAAGIGTTIYTTKNLFDIRGEIHSLEEDLEEVSATFPTSPQMEDGKIQRMALLQEEIDQQESSRFKNTGIVFLGVGIGLTPHLREKVPGLIRSLRQDTSSSPSESPEPNQMR